MRYIKVIPMEWNSLILSSISIISIISLTFYVNQKVKEA